MGVTAEKSHVLGCSSSRGRCTPVTAWGCDSVARAFHVFIKKQRFSRFEDQTCLQETDSVHCNLTLIGQPVCRAEKGIIAPPACLSATVADHPSQLTNPPSTLESDATCIVPLSPAPNPSAASATFVSPPNPPSPNCQSSPTGAISYDPSPRFHFSRALICFPRLTLIAPWSPDYHRMCIIMYVCVRKSGFDRHLKLFCRRRRWRDG